MIYLEQGRDEDAREAVEKSVAISEELKIPRRIVHSKALQIRYLLDTNQLDEASHILDEAEQLADPRNLGELAIVLTLAKGSVLQEKGIADEAAKLMGDALQQARDHGFLVLELKAAVELVRLDVSRGQLHEAQEIARTALRDAERRRLRPLMAEAHTVLAAVYLARQSVDEANAELDAAATLANDFSGMRLLREIEMLRERALPTHEAAVPN